MDSMRPDSLVQVSRAAIPFPLRPSFYERDSTPGAAGVDKRGTARKIHMDSGCRRNGARGGAKAAEKRRKRRAPSAIFASPRESIENALAWRNTGYCRAIGRRNKERTRERVPYNWEIATKNLARAEAALKRRLGE
jgi:hypothetical protein